MTAKTDRKTPRNYGIASEIILAVIIIIGTPAFITSIPGLAAATRKGVIESLILNFRWCLG